MTTSRDLTHRIKSLREISSILTALKNLSLLEIRKLARCLDGQIHMLGTIEAAARDFLRYYPQADPEHAFNIFVLIGAERGFCGEFNTTLARWLTQQHETNKEHVAIIAVGRKLANSLSVAGDRIKCIEGPAVVEQIEQCLSDLTDHLSQLQSRHGRARVTLVHHREDSTTITETPILPPRFELVVNLASASLSYAPVLTCNPKEFYADLVDSYILAALFRIFYVSLMAEQQRRIQHLQGAVQRLDQQVDDLIMRRNAYRREEITQELETILLSAETV